MNKKITVFSLNNHKDEIFAQLQDAQDEIQIVSYRLGTEETMSLATLNLPDEAEDFIKFICRAASKYNLNPIQLAAKILGGSYDC